MTVIRFWGRYIEDTKENRKMIIQFCKDFLQFHAPSDEKLIKKVWITKKYRDYVKHTLVYEYTSKINTTKIQRDSLSYSVIETAAPPIFEETGWYKP